MKNPLLNTFKAQGVRYEYPSVPQYHRNDKKKHGATDGRPVFTARVAKSISRS